MLVMALKEMDWLDQNDKQPEGPSLKWWRQPLRLLVHSALY